MTINPSTILDTDQQQQQQEATPPIQFKKKKNLSTQARSKHQSLTTPSLEDEPDETDQDQTPTLDQLVAFRKLKQAKVGIELDKLNAGEPKKKKKKRNPNSSAGAIDDQIDPSSTRSSHQAGPDDDLTKDDRLAEDDPEDEDARTRKIIKSNHFTQQTNTLDVDKHMMAYIEEELQNRRKDAVAAGKVDSSEPVLKGLEAIASLDPRDELYQVAEKYRIDKKPVVEGNVTLSATMLTSIPEVDLGIDNRIKNFEATEKAKRQLTEQRAQSHQVTHGSSSHNATKGDSFLADTREHFAADRFLLPNHMKQNPLGELDSLKIARLEKEGLHDEAEALRKELKRQAYQLKYGNNPGHSSSGYGHHHRPHGSRSNQVATDDRAVENFRKRMGGRR